MFPADMSNGQEGARLPESGSLGCGGKACNVLPGIASLPHLLTIGRGGIAMTSWAEMLGNGTIRGKESLGMPWWFEALDTLVVLARRGGSGGH